MNNEKKEKAMSTKKMVLIAVLSALGFALTFLKIPLPMFPSFLDLEVSDLTAIVGTLALGTPAGVMIVLIRNLIGWVIKPVGGGIGQLANFIICSAYIIPFGFIYKRKKNVVGFITGATVGTVLMIVVACIANYYFLIPAYAAIFGAPIEAFVDMTAKVNGFVKDFETLIIFAIAPFNLLKSVVVSILGYAVYKAVRPVIHKIY